MTSPVDHNSRLIFVSEPIKSVFGTLTDVLDKHKENTKVAPITLETLEELKINQSFYAESLKNGTCSSVYKIRNPEDDRALILRSTYPSHSEERRKREMDIQQWTADQGVGCKIINHDHKWRWMTLPFIEGGVFEPNYQGYIKDLALMSKNLHDKGLPDFLNKENESTSIQRLWRQLKSIEDALGTLPDFLVKVKEGAQVVINRLNDRFFQRTLCHLSLHPENIMIDNGHFTLIDWTMSGPDDPFIDIAYIAMYYNFTSEQEVEFLMHYDGSEEAKKHYALARSIPFLLKVTWGMMNVIKDKQFTHQNMIELEKKIKEDREVSLFDYLSSNCSGKPKDNDHWVNYTYAVIKTFQESIK